MRTITITAETESNAAIATRLCKLSKAVNEAWNDYKVEEAGRVADASGHPHESGGWYDVYLTERDRLSSEVGPGWRAAKFSEAGYEGWTHLGGGAFRDAFLGPDGVVYKVGRRPQDKEDNLYDALISERLRDKPGCPERFRIPFMDLVGDVLVTFPVMEERAWGDSDDDYTQYNKFSKWCLSHGVGILDGWTNNIRFHPEDNCWYATDMGNWTVDSINKHGRAW